MKIIIPTLVLILFSCNSSKQASKMKNFPSGDYEILEFKAEKFKAEKTYSIKINAEDQRISGKFDCNSYSCEYEKEGQSINFGFAMASKMYCEGEMHNENAFFGKLSKFKSFKYDGEFLEFYNGEDEMILKLKKQ